MLREYIQFHLYQKDLTDDICAGRRCKQRHKWLTMSCIRSTPQYKQSNRLPIKKMTKMPELRSALISRSIKESEGNSYAGIEGMFAMVW